MRYLVISLALTALFLCSCKPGASHAGITSDMAYEGINNYCHSNYDWSIAADNPSMMTVTMGEETTSEFQVIFRSYTGALVYFYVDKASGKTRMVESVPALDVDSVIGTIDLMDYLDKKAISRTWSKD